MAEKLKCYWTTDSYCGVKLHEKSNEIFIIGSCDSTRREYIDKIINTVQDEFGMIAIFAEDLKQHNGYKAYCSNICSPIIRSALVIVDLSAPDKNISCSNCDQEILVLQQSVNAYWEYGYVCGLAKKVIMLIDESQIDNLPFDVADTQVEPYNIENLDAKLKDLISLKLEDPLHPNRYNYLPPPLSSPQLGANDHRIQPLIDLLKFKAVDYYREIRPEKKREFFKLIELLCSFKPSFQKYTNGGGVRTLIKDFLNLNLEELKSRLDTGERIVDIPGKSTLIIAGDFCLKAQKYRNDHPELEKILIKDLHGEFDTEIRSHPIFPHQMSFDREFLLAIEELRICGFIRGEPYLSQDCKTEFIVPSSSTFIKVYRKLFLRLLPSATFYLFFIKILVLFWMFTWEIKKSEKAILKVFSFLEKIYMISFFIIYCSYYTFIPVFCKNFLFIWSIHYLK
ncbi:MAG: hypothetical protein ACTSR7_18110 [Promethearchaeota archaeon]